MGDTTLLVARGLIYHWASRLFAYPDERLLDTLSDKRTWQEMTEAVGALDDPASPTKALTALRLAWLDCVSSGEALGTEYTRLFARQVICPPYETSYSLQGVFSRVQHLSDLGGIYAAFGFRMSENHKDLQDHISLELEFLSVLCSKEAIALERGWSARARICEDARRKFRSEHLSWIPRFGENLRQRTSLAFYPAAAGWVEALLELEAAHEYRDSAVAPR